MASQQRYNAKQKAKGPTGIAFATGGAQSISDNATMSNASPEAKAANDNKKKADNVSGNFGNKIEQERTKGKQIASFEGKNYSGPQSDSTAQSSAKDSPPTTKAEKPKDRPNGGDVPVVSSEEKEVVRFDKYSGISEKNNGPQNPKDSRNTNAANYNKKGSQDNGDGFSRGTREVPKSQRGGGPVGENPAGVSADTATTISKITQGLLDQSRVKGPVDGADEGAEASFDEYGNKISQNESGIGEQEEEELRRQELISEQQRQAVEAQEEANQEQQSTEEENAEVANENRKINNHKFTFPIFTFTLCLAEWLGSLILSLTALLLSIIPFLNVIGFGLAGFLRFWKISLRVFIRLWCIAYIKKETLNLRKTFSKSKRIAQITTQTIKIKPLEIVSDIISIAPFVGDLLPVNAYSVWSAHRELKRNLKAVK